MASPSPTSPALPLRLVPRKGKTVAMLLVSAAFVPLGLLMAQEQAALGWLGAAFFAVFAVVIALQLLPGASYLELTRDGFTFKAPFRERTERWQDIRAVGVGRVKGRKRVGWLDSSGAQGSLPDSYGMTAEDLAALMNDVKRRAA